MTTPDWIISRPGLLGGKPCVRNTRLSVEFLLEVLASGATQAQILEEYPQLTVEGLRAAIAYAAERMGEESAVVLPATG